MKTIRGYLLAWLIGGMLLCTFIAGVLLYNVVRAENRQLFNNQLKHIAGSLLIHLPPLAAEPGKPGTDEGDTPDDGIVVQVWDTSGKLIYTSRPALIFPRYPDDGLKTVPFRGERWRVYGEARSGQFVQVAQPIGLRKALGLRLIWLALAPFLVLVPMLAAIIWFAVHRGLSPLRRTAESIEQRGPNALEPVETFALPRELRPMVDALNSLMKRLERELTWRQEFTAEVAHELRSPLTTLKLQLQLAERVQTDEQRVKAFAKLHARLDRATHLVLQLLTLARHERGLQEDDMRPVDLAKLAHQVVADFVPQAESKDIALTLDTTADVPANVQGDEDGLRTLLANVVDNAVRYTAPGGRVEVAALWQDEAPAWRVVDTGPGIPWQERLRVFDRFYRLVDATTVGSGLGLAIVKNIAERHQATVTLSDNPAGHGLVVTVAFSPVDRKAAELPFADTAARRHGQD
ncbi:ATP-binding protein [Ralstonia flaminis]|jgi:two-component system OmpR family sensor kinase|uniref:histidine kinase n=1 Tax=Ralstonia flaminis TaxID=3058597 RepID=A0ABN9JRL4_9RALS|nr:ATP-binding protein [Ralstonia sp. LMG 18101]CAJ0822233.1 Sensor protein QseC [Ralstonia sp. LMG 18101]